MSRQPLPPKRWRAPSFIKLSFEEIDALLNRVKHELGGSVYLALVAQSVFTGAAAGSVLTSYDTLRSILRPPKPERGRWALAPSTKTVRTCMQALEDSGLIARDKAWNETGKQLRCQLLRRGGKSSP